jgi:peptidoglycan hydrolase-like protein with peptidoglycan-binding domain
MRLLTLLGYLMVLTLTANADVTSHAAPVVNQNLATQIALDRIGFSPGEIDGQAGRNLQRALAAFQRSRQIRTVYAHHPGEPAGPGGA